MTRIDLTKSVTRWPLKIRLLRGVWQFIVSPIIRLLPARFSPVRATVLRLWGARVGKGCLIMPGVKVLIPWKLILHDFVVLGAGVEVYNHESIEIYSMTVISQRTFLCGSTHDYTNVAMPLVSKRISIGSECWIAAEAFIGPGVTIGDGAVVGARSVVTRDVPEWSVYAGNPARFVKVRKLEGTI